MNASVHPLQKRHELHELRLLPPDHSVLERVCRGSFEYFWFFGNELIHFCGQSGAIRHVLRTVHAHGARSGPNRTPAPPWIFLSGTVRADFFVLPDSSSFWSHFSAANYKTAKFSFKILCRCAELPAKRMDSARRSARALASSCSQHSRRAAHSSRRSKRGDYSAI